MRFNIFDRKVKETPRMVAIRGLAKGFRDMAEAIEQDLSRNAKENTVGIAAGKEICDECAAELAALATDGTAKLVTLFAQEAKVPPQFIQSALGSRLAKSLFQMRGRDPMAEMFNGDVPPRSMMS
jgi:hypothetical protein